MLNKTTAGYHLRVHEAFCVPLHFMHRYIYRGPVDSISLFVRDELERVTKEKHSDLNVNPKEVDQVKKKGLDLHGTQSTDVEL